MASSRYQQGIVKRYYENRDTIALQNLGEISSDLFLCEDTKKAAKLWERAGKALQHAGASTEEKSLIEKILADRDVTGLCQLVNQLTAPGRSAANTPKTGSTTPPPPTPPPSSAHTPATKTPSAPATSAGSGPALDPTDSLVLKKAMKAFRKRLKLTRLDEESKLGVGPFSGGANSGIVAISPPNQFPLAVWEKLAEDGRLKRSGKGFYALASE